MSSLLRVLGLRGYEAKDGPGKEDGRTSDSVGEDLDESLRKVLTDEMPRNAREQSEIKEQKKKRIRKEGRSWHWVIKKLVEDGLLPKEITVQAFKKILENRYSFHPWDET